MPWKLYFWSGRAPQAVDDLDLFGEEVEAFGHVRERDSVGAMFGLEPARTEAQLDPPAAHRVDLGDRDRQRSGQPERGRRDERAEPDAGRLTRHGAQRHPGVGRAGQPVDAHRQVVVGAEEGVEAEVFGGPGHAELVVVGRALLGFGEDAQVHLTNPSDGGRSGVALVDEPQP